MEEFKEIYRYETKMEVALGWERLKRRIKMKCLVQFMAMLSDVMLIAAAIGLSYYAYIRGNVILYVISFILLSLSYNTWKSQGGFIAWTKKGRKAFFTEWDKMVKCEKEL